VRLLFYFSNFIIIKKKKSGCKVDMLQTGPKWSSLFDDAAAITEMVILQEETSTVGKSDVVKIG